MSGAERIAELLQFLKTPLSILDVAEQDGIMLIASDPLRWAGVCHLAQLAVQACVDMGDEILACEGAEEPPRSRDVFVALRDIEVLTPELAFTLADLADFRDALVRGCSPVTPAMVEARLPGLLISIRAFAQAVTDWLHGG